MSLESLETRRLLAGNVTAFLNAATSTLVIRGDNKSNDIIINPGATSNGYNITGRHGTTVNGRPSAFVDTGGNIENLSIDMGNGDDVVDILAYAFDHGSIVTGNGDDTVGLDLDAFASGLDIDTGNGNDSVRLIDDQITGDLNINTGNGNDSVAFAHQVTSPGVTVSGNTHINGGRGNDVLTDLADLQTAGTQSITGIESIS
jgi:hypothetical protein